MCGLDRWHVNRDGAAANNTVFQQALDTTHLQATARYQVREHQFTLTGDWWEKLPDNQLGRSHRIGVYADYTWHWGSS